jgi:hypothetical protein
VEIEAAVELAEHHAKAGDPMEARRSLDRARRVAAALQVIPGALSARLAALKVEEG